MADFLRGMPPEARSVDVLTSADGLFSSPHLVDGSVSSHHPTLEPFCWVQAGKDERKGLSPFIHILNHLYPLVSNLKAAIGPVWLTGSSSVISVFQGGERSQYKPKGMAL